MKLASALAAALTFVGRHGTLVAAASIFVGLAVPGSRCNFQALSGRRNHSDAHARVSSDRPNRVASSFYAAWADCCRYFVGDADRARRARYRVLAFGLDQRMPGLYFMLVLQMSAPGLMSSPALAALLGLDVALTLASVSTAITPLTASLFTHIYLGAALVSPLGFGLKLFLIIAGCALAGAVIRCVTGRNFIEAQRERIDGLSVLAMFMFAVAAWTASPSISAPALC